MCPEVPFCMGWKLDNEVFMEFKSRKSPSKVTWARPWPLTVLSVAKRKGRGREAPCCPASLWSLSRGAAPPRVTVLRGSRQPVL